MEMAWRQRKHKASTYYLGAKSLYDNIASAMAAAAQGDG